MPKTREVLRKIKADGWTLDRVRGSHYVYVHATKPGIVVVPVHGTNLDISPGLMRSILKQAGLKP